MHGPEMHSPKPGQRVQVTGFAPHTGGAAKGNALVPAGSERPAHPLLSQVSKKEKTTEAAGAFPADPSGGQEDEQGTPGVPVPFPRSPPSRGRLPAGEQSAFVPPAQSRGAPQLKVRPSNSTELFHAAPPPVPLLAPSCTRPGNSGKIKERILRMNPPNFPGFGSLGLSKASRCLWSCSAVGPTPDTGVGWGFS